MGNVDIIINKVYLLIKRMKRNMIQKKTKVWKYFMRVKHDFLNKWVTMQKTVKMKWLIILLYIEALVSLIIIFMC